MRPDRSNYEIWLIDWLDGRLDDSQAEQLKIFLDENPDLREVPDTLNLLNLKTRGESFPLKEKLKKTPADLTDSQFEYLCIADLENDLSPEQADDLSESMANDPDRLKTHKLTQKLKLIPGKYVYTQKYNLKKTTLYQRALRLSLIGLSAAATVALLIILNLPAPVRQPEKPEQASSDIFTETTPVISPVETIPENNLKREVLISSKPETEMIKIPDEEIISKTTLLARDATETADSLHEKTEISINSVPTITFLARLNITGEYQVNNSLVALNPDPIIPDFDDRSNVNRFLSKFFHEKILKDESAGDKPVRGYEIAEAGITGLNKLFGTELALYRNTDENGEVTSVYFSSRLLKFNAPVKKVTDEP